MNDVSRGDRVAFARLYQRVSSHLFSLCLRMLNRKDLAEEVLQDSFVKIWKHAASFNPDRGRAFTWMATIVRNTCLDQIRKVKREPLSAFEFKPEWSQTYGLKALANFKNSEEAQSLRKCLEELETEQRDVILWSYWKGWTHEELAAQLDKPLGTVKSWIRRGLTKLRGCLER